MAQFAGAPRRIVGLSISLLRTTQSLWCIMVSCTQAPTHCEHRMVRSYGDPIQTSLLKENIFSWHWLMASCLAVQRVLCTRSMLRMDHFFGTILPGRTCPSVDHWLSPT